MRITSLLFFLLAAIGLKAQETTNFTMFFVNPYTVNPSFAGVEGRTGMFLTYRNQWTDFEGSPTVANFSFHTALSKNINFGTSVNNDQRGILNTTSALITLGYTMRMSKKTFLRFGISAGAASNGLDLNDVEITDPALINALDANMFLLGNAGLSLHINNFHLGIAMPDLYQPKWVSDQQISFEFGELRTQDRFIASISNRFYFGNEKHVFEPYVLYRINNTLPQESKSQLEAAAIVQLNNALWFGGTYKQDFGIAGTVGIKSDKLAIGGSYTFKNIGLNKIASPTWEITISTLFGDRKPPKHKYSFISTGIEVDPEPVKKPKPEPKVVEPEPEPEKPPVEEVKPPVEEVKPPVEEVKPPVEEVKPPVEEVKPPVEEKVADVVVKKGSHAKEIPTGSYVIVGVYSTSENAEKYSEELIKKGYQEARYGYISERGHWYVYVHTTDDPNLSRVVRDSVRKVAVFKDAWTLEVRD